MQVAGPLTAITLPRQLTFADVVATGELERQPADPAWPGKAVVDWPSQPDRGLPVPALRLPARQTSAHYTVTTVDARGRLADASPLRILQWAPRLPISLTLIFGALVAAAQPGGLDTVTSQGHLRLPADLRHALRLDPGDRVLVAAHADRGLLIAYTMPVLDAMVSDCHSSFAAWATA
jgi:hypothetical protein